jgi:hypothetical protein
MAAFGQIWGGLGSGASILGTVGTWTPAVSATVTPGTPAYNVQVGSYEIIGRQVTARFHIELSGWTGSPSGSVLVTGLPVAATATANDHGYCVIGFYIASGLASLNYGLTGFITPGESQVRITQNGNVSSATLTTAQAGTGLNLWGMAIYRT